jgi:hypothetical protein
MSDRGPGTEGSRGKAEPALSRRGLFGAVAGALAAVAGITRSGGRRDSVAEKRRRGRFWIGHT